MKQASRGFSTQIILERVKEYAPNGGVDAAARTTAPSAEPS